MNLNMNFQTDTNERTGDLYQDGQVTPIILTDE